MSLDLSGSYFGIGADLDGWSLGGRLSIPMLDNSTFNLQSSFVGIGNASSTNFTIMGIISIPLE